MNTVKLMTILNLRKKSQIYTKGGKLKQKTTMFSGKNQKLSSFLCFSLLLFLERAVTSTLFIFDAFQMSSSNLSLLDHRVQV